MDPLMLRTPHVFARPSSLDVSEIKARAATISDPEPTTDTTNSTLPTIPDDDLGFTNQPAEDWPLNANNTTTIYPPIRSTGHGAPNEVDRWKIRDSPFHLEITVNPYHRFDEAQLCTSLQSSLDILSQKPLHDGADETWTTTTSGHKSTPIILNLTQRHQSSEQGGAVIEPLQWRQLITLLERPDGIWGYYTTTRQFYEMEFVVWDEGRAGGKGDRCAHGSMRKG